MTTADSSLTVDAEKNEGDYWWRRRKKLMVSPVDVEDDGNCVVDAADDAADGDENANVDVVDHGWMFVATIDILLDEQVHVRLAGLNQILFSLLLLHCHNHLHLLLSVTPPKLQKEYRGRENWGVVTREPSFLRMLVVVIL